MRHTTTFNLASQRAHNPCTLTFTPTLTPAPPLTPGTPAPPLGSTAIAPRSDVRGRALGALTVGTGAPSGKQLSIAGYFLQSVLYAPLRRNSERPASRRCTRP